MGLCFIIPEFIKNISPCVKTSSLFGVTITWTNSAFCA